MSHSEGMPRQAESGRQIGKITPPVVAIEIQAREVTHVDEVQVAIAIEVEPRGTVGAPMTLWSQTRGLGDVQPLGSVIAQQVGREPIVGIVVRCGELAVDERQPVLGDPQIEVPVAIDVTSGDGLRMPELSWCHPSLTPPITAPNLNSESISDHHLSASVSVQIGQNDGFNLGGRPHVRRLPAPPFPNPDGRHPRTCQMQLNTPLRGLLQQGVSEQPNAIGRDQEVGPGLKNRNTALDRRSLAKAVIAKSRCLTVGPIRLYPESRGPDRTQRTPVGGCFKDNLQLQVGQKSRRDSLGLRMGTDTHQSDLHPTQRVTRRCGNPLSQIGQHAGVETAGSHRSLHPQDQFLLEADRQLGR